MGKYKKIKIGDEPVVNFFIEGTEYMIPLVFFHLFVDPNEEGFKSVDKFSVDLLKGQYGIYDAVNGYNYRFESVPEIPELGCLRILKSSFASGPEIKSNNNIRGSFYFDQRGNLVSAECVMLPSNFGNPGGYTIRVLDGKIELKYYDGDKLRMLREAFDASDRAKMFTITGLEKMANDVPLCAPPKDMQVLFEFKKMQIATVVPVLTIIYAYFSDPRVLEWDILDLGVGKCIRNEILKYAVKENGEPKASFKWFIPKDGEVRRSDSNLAYDVETIIDGATIKLRFYFLNGKLTRVSGVVYLKNADSPIPSVCAISYSEGSFRVSYYSEQFVSDVLPVFSIEKVFSPDFEDGLENAGYSDLISSNDCRVVKPLDDLSPKAIIDEIMSIIQGGTDTCANYIAQGGALKHKKEKWRQ